MGQNEAKVATKKPQSDIFPPWEDMRWVAESHFQAIVTPEFAGRLDLNDVIYGKPGFDGAMRRMERYYRYGMEKGNIWDFDKWFFEKCESAARDARKHLLGLRRNEEQPVLIRLYDILTHQAEPDDHV